MQIETMLTEGLFLMLTGMAFVITFLSILVLLLTIMAKILPEQRGDVESSMPKPVKQQSSKAITAVLSAAIHQHRMKNGVKD